jgi:ABC-type transport system involved in multi-copper enzyme maturation permease subunit
VNPGILLKSLRETWVVSLLFCLAIIAAEALFAYVLPIVERDYAGMIAGMAFAQNMLKALLGADAAAGIGPNTFKAVAWVHPVVLTIVWAHAIVLCTRSPAGEVDRGTGDVFFTLPVGRWNIWRCDALVWAASAAALVTCAAAGHFIGSGLSTGSAAASIDRLIPVGVNLLALGAAVAAVSCLASSLCSRRGVAMAIAFGVVVASFLLNFLAQFWPPAEAIAFLGILRYYRPINIFDGAGWPARDIAALLAVALALWIIAGTVFARRDLCSL